MGNAIVTGASSGIGRAIASMLSNSGYQVFDLSRRAGDAPGIVHIDCDVTDQASVDRAFAAFHEAASTLDVLVCNAGYGISGAVEFTDDDAWMRQMDVNFDGAVRCVRAALPTMREEGRGRIVFISSLAAIFPIAFQSFYSASKAAVSVFSEALRIEYGRFGIETCVLYLGDVRTGFTDNRVKTVEGDDVFEGHISHAVAVMEEDERHGMEPARIASALRSLMKRRRLPIYKVIGSLNKLEYAASRILPRRFQLYVLGRIYS